MTLNILQLIDFLLISQKINVVMKKMRRYPVGIQTFADIIEGNYTYVDKTGLMWKMQNIAKYAFLSRPRRFGKSLLSSTIHSFFDGDRRLFEGLKVMEMETEWKKHPVIHLDLSRAKGSKSVKELRERICLMLEEFTGKYGSNPSETMPGSILMGVMRRAYEQTGERVVVIIDEYDAPLLDVLHNDQLLEELRDAMQEFYIPLKAADPIMRFCFITGITKFSQLSIFSTINNLKNISMMTEFATICGITDRELVETFEPDMAIMAEAMGCTAEDVHEKLQKMYDGYHFAEDTEGVYNPFSLLNAFMDKKLGLYWFTSGTPKFLIYQMQHFRTDITAMEDLELPSTAFDKPTEAMTTALPLLYQSGYLTIKDYDSESQIYTLSIPNKEVRIGYTDGLLPTYVGIESFMVQTGFALRFWRALKKNDVNLAFEEMRAYLASLPYVEGFKKKLSEVSNAEGFYEWSLYLIFSMLNVYVRTQVKCAGGRADMVVHMPDATYVVELKLNGTAQEALDQIESRGYATPYSTEGKKVVKVGVSFSMESKTIEDWIVSDS